MSKQAGGNIKLAVIADEVYKPSSQRGTRDGWKYISGDKRHGIWERDGQAAIGIRGTDFKDPKDVIDDAGIAIGALKLTPRYKRSKRWVRKAIKKYGKKNVQVAGHSLGGKISKELAKDFGIKGSTFNAGASVSDAVSSIGDRVACKVNKKGKRCRKAKKVENYRTKIDPVSAAAIGDINTTTVKRKKALDPHAIANFIPEEEGASDKVEQGGEGVFDRLKHRRRIEKGLRKLTRERKWTEERILSDPNIVRNILEKIIMELPSDAPETFPSIKALIDYAVREADLRREAARRGIAPLPDEEEGASDEVEEQEEQEDEELEGGGCGMCGSGMKRYEFAQVGGRRRRMKKSKNMVQVMPEPTKPKRKPMSQKEYCSLYRC